MCTQYFPFHLWLYMHLTLPTPLPPFPCVQMVAMRQYQVVGRKAPTEKEPNPAVYRMKVRFCFLCTHVCQTRTALRRGAVRPHRRRGVQERLVLRVDCRAMEGLLGAECAAVPALTFCIFGPRLKGGGGGVVPCTSEEWDGCITGSLRSAT